MRTGTLGSVFMFYAIAAGIGVGLATGGHLGRLGDVRLRWAPLALVGLVVQLVLFSSPVAAAIAGAGPALYVVSTAAVLVFVVRNIRMPGLGIVAAGAAANLAAIVANGGYMPASPSALVAAGISVGPEYSNSAVVAAPWPAPLTDIFALPSWLPFANVFSVGDVVIGIGIAVAIVAQMRADAPEPAVVLPGTSLHRADPLVPRAH